ncbi:MAG: LamG-like jellyroll fold domain-containing protein [Saprospiraceae bacterium]
MKRQLHSLILMGCCLFFASFLLAQTPDAHYDFSGNAKDISSFANHASVNGATLVQDRFGWSNNAMNFDGKQAGLLAPNGAHLNTKHATVAFWVNATEIPGQGEVYLLSFGGWQERYKISLPAHGKLIWTTNSTIDGIGDMDAGDGNELQIGVWTHVAFVHDGAKDIIYMNGAKVAEKDVMGDLNNSTRPLAIGFNNIDVGNYFNGALDEVMIFGSALTDMEITDLYNQQSVEPAIAPGIVAAYTFNGNGEDVSGFKNTADVFTGSPTTDRFGFGNQALTVSGSSVTAPNSDVLNSATTTIAFWVKPNSLPANGEVFLLSNGGWQERWKISLPPHGKPVFTTHSGGACCSDLDSGDGNELQVGVWSHLFFVHDGTKDKIFLNGVKVAEKDAPGDLDPTTHPLGIGFDPIDGAGSFDGVLDDIGIFNTAIPDVQIAALYASQIVFPGTPTNLVADFSLNGNGTDNTQFGNHAILNDASAPASNRHGWGSNALTGGATAENSAAWQSANTTISFWIKPNSLPGNGEVYLLSHGGWQERWKISLPPHGKPVFTTHSGGACCSDMDSGDGNELVVGTWTHVVMVHNGTQDLIYMNGAKVASKDVSGALDRTKYPLGIGYDPIDGGNFFDGVIDDVQLYNEALNDMAIAGLYAAQSVAPTVMGDLVADYSFSGNGHDGTAYNNHASSPALSTDRFGKANKAANFNGTSGVTAANSPQLNSPNTTISFWVNPTTLPGTGEAYLLSCGGWQERWKISLPPHGKPVFTTHAGGNCCSDMDSGDGNELVVGTWTHVAMVHDGVKDQIFMNGNLVASKDVAGDLDNTVHPLGIGYDPIDVANYFDGKLDEVQIYNVALDATQIANLYALQNTPPAGSDDEAPCAPLNLTAEVEFNNVSLAWYPAEDNVGVTAYNVYLDGALVNTSPYTFDYFEALTPLTEYEFGVTAVDDAGNESLRTTLRVTTGQDPTPDTTPPTVPGNLMGNPSFNSVLLSWDASTDDTQVAGYIVWVDGDYYDSLAANVLSALVTGLNPQELYSFEVGAFDLAGNLSDLAELTISTTEPLVTAEPGLVAHYPFDGNANDATPYMNHGVIGGDPIFEPSTHPHGGGMNIKFDGMMDSVLAPNAVQLLSDFTTVSFWIRVDGQNPADPESYILDFGHWDQRWKISLPQHLKIVWTTNSENTQFPNFISDMDSGDGNEMVIGFWWYVTMVHDGDNDLIYVNGIQANSKPASGTLNTTARPLGFGNNPVDGGQYFQGGLDNVKIYNRALTSEEVEQLFNTGSIVGTTEPNLVDAYIEQVYPNPSTDLLTVKHSLPTNQDLLLRVFDLQGRQLDAVKLQAADVATGQFNLNVEHYPAGMYSLNFVLGSKNLGSLKFNKN